MPLNGGFIISQNYKHISGLKILSNFTSVFFFSFFFFFWLCPETCGILVSQPGIEPVLVAVKNRRVPITGPPQRIFSFFLNIVRFRTLSLIPYTALHCSTLFYFNTKSVKVIENQNS